MNKLFLSLLFSISTLLSNAQQGKIDYIQNQNQWEPQIRFKANIPNGALFLTENKLVYSFYKNADLDRIHELKHQKKNVMNEKVHFHAYEVSFLNANPNPVLQPKKKKSEYHNYFIGSDKSKWAGNVPLFENIIYENIYDGIDLSFYSKGNSVKYDFIVKANSDPSIIKLNFKGVNPIVKSNGDLYIKSSVNEITELSPYAYQVIDGKKMQIECKFIIGNNNLSYSFPNGYQHNLDLIIDPILIFSTYSGGTGTTYGFSATYDTAGSLYAGGECFGVGWPSTTGSFQVPFGGGIDAGINKYTPIGNALIYSTYYGGSSSETPNNMVVNVNNELVVCGSTSSLNLPVTTGCYDNSLGGTKDIFVAHFNAAGSALIGATYVGGSGIDGQNIFSLSPNYGDGNRGEVYIDSNQNILCAVSTESSDFPTTAGCYQSTFGGIQDGCIFKLNPTCTSLLYGTYLGGSNEDACFAINVNHNHRIVVVGGTKSTNFPTSSGALHTSTLGGTDGFVTILDDALSTLIASSYLGTAAYDHAFKLQVDAGDNVYVCGQTAGVYPVTAGLYTNANGGIFIDKLDSSLMVSSASTVIGQNPASSSNLVPTAFLYDVCGNIYFSGFNAVTGLPLTTNAHQTTPGGFWICVLSNNMTSLFYATYMGAVGDHVDGGTSRFDPQGIIYQSVCTISPAQYNSPGCWSPSNQASSWDVASFKFDFEATGVHAAMGLSPLGNDSACVPAVMGFVNNSTNATSYLWDFGDGSPTTTATAPTYTYMTPGTYTVTLKAYNPLTCVTEDSAFTVVHIFQIQKPQVVVKDTTYCDPNVLLTLDASVTNINPNMTFHWEPSGGIISGGNTLHPVITPAAGNTFTLTVTDSIPGICKETSDGIVHLSYGDTTKFKVSPVDTTVCYGETVQLTAEGGTIYTWSPSALLSDPNAPVVSAQVFSLIVYSVKIEDAAGCKATRQVSVNIFPLTIADAGDDDIIKYGESIQLNASGGTNYNWNADATLSSTSIANPIASPLSQTNYIVTVRDHNGCYGKDSVTIYVSNGIVPNAFSPNGDGKNDLFKFIPSNQYVALKSLKVFNRWGQEVFATANATIGWNGMYKGKICDMGTYYYLLEYSIGAKNYTEKGDVTLLR